MDEITRQKVLKILEGIPVDRQIRILKAAKVMVRMRAGRLATGMDAEVAAKSKA